MTLSAVLAKRQRSLVYGQPQSRKAPEGKSAANDDGRLREVLQETRLCAEAAARKNQAKSGSVFVPRRIYPQLVELKIAGRSDKEIAEKFDISVESLKLHIAKAMSEYRRGQLKIKAGEAIEEARRKGAEDGNEFVMLLLLQCQRTLSSSQ